MLLAFSNVRITKPIKKYFEKSQQTVMRSEQSRISASWSKSYMGFTRKSNTQKGIRAGNTHLEYEDLKDDPHEEVPDMFHLVSSMVLEPRNASIKTSYTGPEHDAQKK